MEGRRDVRHGGEDVAEALLGARGDEGRAGTAVPAQPADDPLLDRVRSVGPGADHGRGRLCAAGADRAQAGPVQGDDRGAPGGVSEADGAAAVRGGAGGGIPGQLRERAGLRAPDPAAGDSGSGGTVRDAPGASGPGRLRRLPAAVGTASRAAGGAGLLAPAVAAVLPAADDGGAVPRPGGRIRALRGRAAGAAVRPDAVGGGVRRPPDGWAAGAERGVLAFRRALGLPAAVLSALPGADQGQGGAADPLCAGELLLRPPVCQ